MRRGWDVDVSSMHYLAVLMVSVVFCPSILGSQEHRHDSLRSHMLKSILATTQRRSAAEVKRAEASLVSLPLTLECCPSVREKVQPRGGVSRDARLLELYRDPRTVQRFYQSSCRAGVAGKPCSFLAPEFRQASTCVQQYSYTYAIVRDFNVSQPYRVDYIRVKSGCACQVAFSLAERPPPPGGGGQL